MRAFLSLLLSASAFSAAEPATTAEWIQTLTDTYNKQGGFIVTYRSEGENKKLDATIALDLKSNVSSIQMIATSKGKRIDMHYWHHGGGDIFIDSNGERCYLSSNLPEFQAWRELFPADTVVKIPEARVIPALLLTADSVAVNMNTSHDPEPNWASATENCLVKKVTAESVTFTSEAYGTLVVSRETGLLEKQSLDGPDDEKRVLTLVDLKKNPGVEAVLAISADWDSAGARFLDMGNLMPGTRLNTMQQLVDMTESGKPSVAELREILSKGRECLATIAGFAFRNIPDISTGTAAAGKLLEPLRRDLYSKWLERTPSAKRDEAEFEKFFAGPQAREEIITTLTAFCLKSPEIRERALAGFFGPGASLKSTGDSGKAAVKLIEQELIRATFHAVMLPKVEAAIKKQAEDW